MARTSKRIASLAGKVLRISHSKTMKTLAGEALRDRRKGK